MRTRVIVLFLVLTGAPGCTSAPADDGRRATAARPTPTASGDPELRVVLQEYAQCLQSEGIDAGEPSFDETGRVTAWPSYAATDDARAAEEACGDDLSELVFRPRGEAAVFLERAHAFQDCMAEQGITDIEVSVEGIEIGPRSRNREIRAAFQECRQFVEPPS